MCHPAWPALAGTPRARQRRLRGSGRPAASLSAAAAHARKAASGRRCAMSNGTLRGGTKGTTMSSRAPPPPQPGKCVRARLRVAHAHDSPLTPRLLLSPAGARTTCRRSAASAAGHCCLGSRTAATTRPTGAAAVRGAARRDAVLRDATRCGSSAQPSQLTRRSRPRRAAAAACRARWTRAIPLLPASSRRTCACAPWHAPQRRTPPRRTSARASTPAAATTRATTTTASPPKRKLRSSGACGKRTPALPPRARQCGACRALPR
jgi:hypothetical protein